jgi:hypothetical protein
VGAAKGKAKSESCSARTATGHTESDAKIIIHLTKSNAPTKITTNEEEGQ